MFLALLCSPGFLVEEEPLMQQQRIDWRHIRLPPQLPAHIQKAFCCVPFLQELCFQPEKEVVRHRRIIPDLARPKYVSLKCVLGNMDVAESPRHCNSGTDVRPYLQELLEISV